MQNQVYHLSDHPVPDFTHLNVVGRSSLTTKSIMTRYDSQKITISLTRPIDLREKAVIFHTEMSLDKMVTVATFPLPQDAYIIRGRLESEGIFCYLKDELTVQADNLISPAIGGVKLQIHEDDVKRVLPILEEVGILEREFKIPHHNPNQGMPRELKFVLIGGAIVCAIIFLVYVLIRFLS